jgi:hypothetical protein
MRELLAYGEGVGVHHIVSFGSQVKRHDVVQSFPLATRLNGAKVVVH